MEKKGDIWISAALYFGLGIIVITLILTAGMPVIDKLRDKNTVIQTKDLMFKLDNNIRDVIRGGAGEQRYVEIEIKKGDFVIDSTNDKIYWKINSKIQISEIDQEIEEGTITILTTNPTTGTVGEYNVELSLDYSEETLKVPVNIQYEDQGVIPQLVNIKTITGLNKLLIKNTGTDPSNNKIVVTITSL